MLPRHPPIPKRMPICTNANGTHDMHDYTQRPKAKGANSKSLYVLTMLNARHHTNQPHKCIHKMLGFTSKCENKQMRKKSTHACPHARMPAQLCTTLHSNSHSLTKVKGVTVEIAVTIAVTNQVLVACAVVSVAVVAVVGVPFATHAASAVVAEVILHRCARGPEPRPPPIAVIHFALAVSTICVQ